jgi:hypothetical protein
MLIVLSGLGFSIIGYFTSYLRNLSLLVRLYSLLFMSLYYYSWLILQDIAIQARFLSFKIAVSL